MSEVENNVAGDEKPAPPPTQAQLYDDLRRIGQLEDQKLAIQTEIDERTERLRVAIPSLDQESLLYKLLSTSLKKAPSKRNVKAAKSAKKKAVKKRRR